MKNSFKITGSLVILILTALSCRKEMPVLNSPYDYQQDNFESVFESFWTGMNNNYIFWDIDPTDWDAVYEEYKPRFAELDINERADVATAFGYFEEMTKNLVDGHYRLTIHENYAEWTPKNFINPGENRHIQSNNYHDRMSLFNFIGSTLPSRYLKTNLKGQATIPGEENLMIMQGYIKPEEVDGKNVCYLFFNRFGFYSYYTKSSEDLPGYTPVKDIIDALAKALADPALDGVIIDLRGNTGGSIDDLSILWGNLLTGEDILGGYSRMKLGEGRLDYSPRIPLMIRPFDNTDNIDRVPVKTTNPVTAPVVVLADQNSVSCAEISTIAISHLPNGYFVGETTWGGQGFLYDDSLVTHSAGTFRNNFFSVVYTPYAINEAPDGKCYEGIGYSPKDAPEGHGVEATYNAAQLAAGIDGQLEKAMEIIRNH